ncbi:MAG: restriction endonuclease subunit S [Thermomicrobiales bacterium]
MDGENLRSRKTQSRSSPTAGFGSIRPHLTAKEGVAGLYYLKSVLDITDISGFITGAAQPKLTQENLRRIRFPISTQRKIADILSAYDELIENNTRRIAILEEMAQRLYQEWFVHFRYPGHEDVPLVESELGLIPEGGRWCDGAFLSAQSLDHARRVESTLLQ